MEWSGDYEKFECALTIKNAKLEDSGIWSCEIESYPDGQYRGEGYGFNVTADMKIQIVPRISGSDTETDTGAESGNTTLFSKDNIKNITYVSYKGNSNKEILKLCILNFSALGQEIY